MGGHWVLVEMCEARCSVCGGINRYVEKLLMGDATQARDAHWVTGIVFFVLPAAVQCASSWAIYENCRKKVRRDVRCVAAEAGILQTF